MSSNKKVIEKISTIRSRKLFTTGGPGAILNLRRDSLMVMDPVLWKNQEEMNIIDEPGLATYLNVSELRRPYALSNEAKDGRQQVQPSINGRPFPRYHICKECGLLFDVSEELKDPDYKDSYLDAYKSKGTICPDCEAAGAYPAGYVVACENGHLQDFPWSEWVHEDSGNKNCGGKLFLENEHAEEGADVDTDRPSGEKDRYVVCNECRASKNLKEVMGYYPLHCNGIHPQIDPRRSACNAKVHVLRKDASNVYFPVTRSTVSILPLISEKKYNEMQYYDLVSAEMDSEEKEYYDKITSFAESMGNLSDVYKPGVKEIEYNVITNYEDFRQSVIDDEMKLDVVDSKGEDDYKTYFSRLLRVRRMREIQALLGFTRVSPPDPEGDQAAHIVRLKCGEEERGKKSWLPAIELKGEGIFLEVDCNKVEEWMESCQVADISERYQYNYEEFHRRKKEGPPEVRDAQYVLLHTLAHLLIKELSLHSGYSISELKERIYSSEEMCGLLIYTISSDIAGTLGGLEELGEWSRFQDIFLTALQKARTCTSDPQCATGSPFDLTIYGGGSLHGAACHSCTIVPDITCESQNQLLDRALVVPLPGREELAFFSELHAAKKEL